MPFPWFRFYHEFATDPKVQAMPPEWQRHLIMIFCFHAAETLKTYDDDVLAYALKVSPEELKKIKSCFLRRGFITKDWVPKNWEKRQGSRDHSTDRVKAFRERKKGVSERYETAVKRVSSPLRNGRETEETLHETDGTLLDKDRDKDRDNTVVVVCPPAHAGGNTPEDQPDVADPSLSRIDALIPDIDETWPDANWGPFAYDLARRYLPHCVEYGFRAAIDKAWKGEQMTMRRIRGLVDWAQANGIKPDEAARVEPRNGRPPRAAETPKTRAQQMKDAAKARLAELKAQGILDENGEIVGGD
jgi:hypothetical protein